MTSKQISKRGARSGSPPALHRLAGGNGPPYSPKFSKTRAGLSIFEASKKISKRGARSGSPPALHRLAGGNGPPCFPTFSKARAGRQHFCVLQENSGLVRSRAPLCIGPRGAIINHASRNFSKHARGVSIFEASQKFQSGGLVRSRPALCMPAGGNGSPCFPKFCKARAGRQHF